MTSDDIKLCDLQGELFEQSLQLNCGSSVFIRRFMNSDLVKRFDNASILNESIDTYEMLKSVNEEYQSSPTGSKQFGLEELFWIGYIYRYWQILFQISSKRIYKICNSTEMRKLYYIYHTLDPEKAIKRILDAKGIDCSNSINRGVELLREIRKKGQS